jgi:hypothetical protein
MRPHPINLFLRLGGWSGVAVAALFNAPIAAVAQTAVTREYDLKAVFVFRFTSFVDWPVSPSAPGAPFIIGILGQDPFGSTLDDVVRSERVKERRIEVRRFARVQDVGACDILFISRSEAPRLPQVLPVLKGRPVLTVSDIDHFASQGGMMELATTGSRIHLVVNLPALEEAGLVVSSKLLRLAKVVGN